MNDLIADLRYARRMLVKSPGFTVVAILTLALGIGANAAVYSIIYGSLLRPLPYRDPGRLIAIWDKGIHDTNLAKIFASYRDYQEFRKDSRTLESVAAATWAVSGATMTGRGPARNVLTIPVSDSFFSLFGIAPARGRTFTGADLNRGCSVVLSDRFWRNTLGAEQAIVGKALILDKRACTVLGVMPPGFVFYPEKTKLWTLITPDFKPPLDRLVVGIFARLRPGVSMAQAGAELASLHAALHKNEGWYERDITPAVYNMQEEFTWMAGRNLRTTLWVLLAAVGLVLLIACLNVANLLFGRSLTRQREMAVRAALGSGQARLIRQLLTEGMVLALMGGGIGVLAAFGAIRYFRSVNPVELPINAEITMNLPVLVFTLALSMLTALVFGLAPAWKASRVDLNETLKSAGRGAVSGGRQRVVKGMLAVQMAFSVVLLAGAGLLMMSVLRMGSAQLGFDSEHVLTTNLSLPLDRYPDEKRRAQFCDDFTRRLDALPGVLRASVSSGLPPYAGRMVTIEVQGRPALTGSGAHDTSQIDVSPDYFGVLKVAVIGGRVFGSGDRPDSDPVAVVNQAFVDKYFPGQNAIGQRIRIPDEHEKSPWMTIVGVTANEKHGTVYQEMAWVDSATVFQPIAQHSGKDISVAIRTAGEQASLGPAVEREITAMDSEIPANGTQLLRQNVTRQLAYPRFRAVLFGAFALFALLLAAIGLHGILQQFVVTRTQEFGVRMAIGAETADILRLVVRQGGLPVIGGLAAGLLCAMGLSRSLSSLLYGVQPGDPLTFTAAALTLIATAALAIAVPARRAARVDPMVALRYE